MKFSDLKVGQKFKGEVGGSYIWEKQSDKPIDGYYNAICNAKYPYGLWDEDDEVILIEEKEVKKNVATVLTKDGTMTVVIDGTVHTVDTSHPNYSKLREAFKNNDWDTFEKSVDIAKSVAQALTTSTKSVEVKNNEILVNGSPLHNTLTQRILTLLNEGYGVDSMVKFLENLVQNPSSRAISELYDFLDHQNLPITEDGCFLAYKSVNSDWYSKAAGSLKLLQGKANSRGQIFNGIGEVIECPRNQVDDERQHECSHGLHVGCLDYSGPQGWYHGANDHVIIVKVNPADCVAVPRDHNAQKLRVCKYEVVGEFKGALNKPVYTQNEEYAHDDDYESVDDVFEDYMDVDDLQVDDQIRFQYQGKLRTAQVTDFDDDLVVVKLLNPEEHVGAYRSFKLDDMQNIQLI